MAQTICKKFRGGIIEIWVHQNVCGESDSIIYGNIFVFFFSKMETKFADQPHNSLRISTIFKLHVKSIIFENPDIKMRLNPNLLTSVVKGLFHLIADRQETAFKQDECFSGACRRIEKRLSWSTLILGRNPQREPIRQPKSQIFVADKQPSF